MVTKPARRTTAQDLTDALRESLRHLGCEFKQNQLAYLSLTSKNEGSLGGALAYRLHKKFAENSKVTIRREWPSNGRRIDIAMLRDGKATVLIEAKAAMAFDPLVEGTRVYPSKEVTADASKLTEVEDVDQRYALAFFTVYDGPPDKGHRTAIKFIDGIERHIRRHRYAKYSFIRKGLPRFREALRCRALSAERVHVGEIPAGKAFGVNVSVW
ncbi:MAG: hypothetical protein OXP11_14020 [Gammaproteobacteria bacterium]|nr:hypothetical protein [Gammaproteobacteria bacterium]